MPAPGLKTKFALVIPTLNEAGNIEPLLNRIYAALEPLLLPYEIVLVDDGSVDGTQQVVSNFSATDARVRLLVRHNQKGLAGAVIHGWKHTDANLLGVMDADLQHDEALLPRMLEVLRRESIDIVVGSRYVEHGSIGTWSKERAQLSRVGAFQRKVRVKDPMSGFFALRRECIEGIDLQPQGFKILLEILVRGRIRSAVEIPFQFGLRHAGKSKADVAVAFHYFSLLGKLSRDLIFKGQQ